MSTKRMLMQSLAMLMIASQNGDIFRGPSRPYQTPSQKRDLPAWKVGEHIIHAKDEKTAMKYAKKRGLWSPDLVIVPADS